MNLDIEVKESTSVTVVMITGSVDSMTSAELMDTLAAQISAQRVRLVADFSRVVYTSSAGLRALLATMKDARRLGGDLRLAGVQPAVHKVLELSGFTSILQLFPDVEAARGSYLGAGTP